MVRVRLEGTGGRVMVRVRLEGTGGIPLALTGP